MGRFSVTLAVCSVAVGSALLATACNPDPTDPSLYNVVSFRNDTAKPVVLVACASAACRNAAWRSEVKPGRVAAEQVSSQGVRERFMVRSKSGGVIGCFDFRFRSRKRRPTRVAISQSSRC